MKTQFHYSYLATAAAALGGSFLVYTAVPAYADCSEEGTVVTCSGDLSGSFSIDADGITDIEIEDLTDDTGGFDISDTAADGASHGDDGADATSLEVSFDGSSEFGASNSGGSTLSVGLQGGDGNRGSNGGKSGGTGGAGGFGGAASLVINDATEFKGESVFSVSSTGGIGGTGGQPNSNTSSNSHGGDGGVGGDGGGLRVEVGDGDFDSASTANGALFDLSSQGGDGGKGGEGKRITNDQDTFGGDGGTGGAGSDVTVNVSFGETAAGTSSSDDTPTVLLESIGGTGGDGGKGQGGGSGKESGGDGGGGGIGGSVSLDVANVGLTTSGVASFGVLARSYGGAGGDSGEAPGGSSGSNGGGLSTGIGGSVDVGFDGTISTTGQNSSGVLAQSVGGFDDSAATSSNVLTYGAGAQSGGAAGTVNVTIADGALIETSELFAEGALAQSIGGGGGKALSRDGVSSLGAGEHAGGDGATASVVIGAATIETQGVASSAVVAQSIGSSGGVVLQETSEDVVSTMGTTADENGGDGLTVSAELNGSTLITNDNYATGVLLQSIGSGGGRSLNQISDLADDLAQFLGAGSGDGGVGGDVTIKTSSETINDIETSGDRAIGAHLQSVGGGGGDSINDLTVLDATVDVSLGQTGGNTAGGDGGVVVFNSPYVSITTDGTNSHGLVLQSIGGGGGSVASILDFTDSSAAGLSYSLGASGGDGGNGGSVQLESDAAVSASVSTTKDRSIGVLMQSVGGGGGEAAASLTANSDTSVDLTLGQSGGSSAEGDADVVAVFGTTFTVETSGDHAHGLLVQSIGGGGGTASTLLDLTDSVSVELDTVLGSSDDANSNSEQVSVEIAESVTTKGDNAHGLVAQSIAGGGGEVAVTISGETPSDVSMTTSLGGTASTEENPELVFVLNDSEIETQGAASMGIVAQSIGAGGGLSNWAWTVDDVSGADITASVGADGMSGDGSSVIVQNTGIIETSGDSGTAIFAQSIGGGGGAVALGNGELLSDATVGGLGSGGGSGGAVEITQDGTISTTGAGAMGIFAQSVGGGGGVVGNPEMLFGAEFSTSSFGLGKFEQESAGGGGDAGDITIEATGKITTTGEQAHGIFAQSVGGSGGIYGLDDGSAIASNVGDEGNGGEININVDSGLTVSGDYAVGIFAQSLGGDESDGGDITIGLDANLTASGTGARGIFAHSDGGNGGGAIDITIDAGRTLAMGDTDVNANEAIYVQGAGDASVTNSGIITSATLGTVIGAANTRMIIENIGTIEGNIELEDGESNIFELVSGTFAPGVKIDLGDSGTFRNQGGTFSPGGEDNIRSTSFYGEWDSAYSGGTLLFDVDLQEGQADDSDSITFRTQFTTARLNGTLEINPTGTSLMNSGESGLAYIAESLTLEDFDIDDLTVTDTSTVDYSIATAFNDYLLELSYSVDYTPDALVLSSNQTAAGNHIDALVTKRKAELAAAQDDGSSSTSVAAAASLTEETSTAAATTTGESYAFVDDLTNHILQIQSDDELKEAYNRIAPGDVFAAADAVLFSSLRFSEKLNQCSLITGNMIQMVSNEGSCAWFDMGARYRDRDQTDSSIGYTENTLFFAGGMQFALANDWVAGFALGYESYDQSNPGFSTDNGNRYQAGLMLQRDLGPMILSGSISGGYSDYDFKRTAYSIDSFAVATAEPNLRWWSAHAKIHQVYGLDNGLTIIPSFDLGYTSYRQDSFEETGGGAYQLEVSEVKSNVFSFNPKVDLVSTIYMADMPTRLMLSAGVLALAGDIKRTAEIKPVVLGSQGRGFEISDDASPWFAEVSFGLETKVSENVTFEAGVDALISSDVEDYSGMLRLVVRF